MTCFHMVVTAADRIGVNASLEALFFGPETFSAPLSSDGVTITHYGASSPSFDEEHKAILLALSEVTAAETEDRFVDWIANLGLSVYVDPSV